MNPLLKKITPHLVAIITFILIVVVYFLPQTQGKVIRQSDVIQYIGMSKEIKDHKEKTGETTLWTNAMFGGMPTYQINTINSGNNLKYLDRLLILFGPGDGPIGRFFTAMVGFYLLLILLGVNPWLSIVGAIAFGFTTNNMILLETGHVTKFKSLIYFPYLVAGILLAFREKYILGGLLFGVGLGLNLLSNHPQMIFYLFITLLVLGIAQFVYSLRENRLVPFLKAVGVLVVGAALAFGSAASNLWVTLEYQKDTMRGDAILASSGEQNQANLQSSSETKGLSWDYAMGWSNNMNDVFASFIPGFVGGGSGEDISRLKNSLRDQRWQTLVRQRGQLPPIYWGGLPFTSGPIYFGAAMLLFFILGLLLVKGPIKWWLGLGVLITFMLSMGKNIEWFNRLFFDYFPLFNKFRTPNSALTVTSFLIPLLGFLALNQFLNKNKTNKSELTKSLLIAGGITGGLYLFFAVLGGSFFSFAGVNDAAYQQAGLDLNPVIQDRKAYMQADSFRSLLIVAATFGLLWFYLKDKLKANHVILGLLLITLFDLWSVGRRYLNTESFVEANRVTTLQPNPADVQILQDKDPNFRVFDSTDPNVFQSSRVSYFHKSLGGYHAAKLQRYEDIKDRHLSQNNQAVYNMLNTKYVIVNGANNQPVAQQNPNALGNAWFIDNIRIVNTPNEEIDALTAFNPSNDAIVHKEFSNYVPSQTFQKGGTIQLIDYRPNRLTYQSNSQAEQFAVFSEIWYGPNKGWQAYIDDNPVEHIRVNYLLRGMKVPAGQHKIEFVFDPKTYKTGSLVSQLSSLILLLGLIGFVGFNFKNTLAALPKEQTPPKEKQQKTTTKKPISKTTSKRKKKKK